MNRKQVIKYKQTMDIIHSNIDVVQLDAEAPEINRNINDIYAGMKTEI